MTTAWAEVISVALLIGVLAFAVVFFVIGYLTLEEQGWFGRMSLVEQQRALDELRRG